MAGNILMLSLLFGSGRDHCDHELAAVVILGLLFGSGEEQCDHEPAVEARRGTL